MDALPLSINKKQLELIDQSIEQSIVKLQKSAQAQQFSSDDSDTKEQNLLTYGTDDYSEAQERIQAIRTQLKSQLESWDSSPDDAKPVPIDLDPYQLKILQMGIKAQINTLNEQNKKELLSDVMKQLPEFSLQEDAD
ncbi:hypothetical protein C7H19_14830 [Aphanothece hegewaldii CCALA 016]|uniref:Uncharacterized protein n=1 Tax=Aphanothece hegewaldii CCALA 016 TaxID=2107694 RepID=A0A2T1LVY2_9CHRO|nr:hypothetical protein [Aphanothece hegewaldii]PSF36016.1 hypothetical protein C7H19_14830 [Aphanothece hegewaldii CCALA 016]